MTYPTMARRPIAKPAHQSRSDAKWSARKTLAFVLAVSGGFYGVLALAFISACTGRFA